MGGSVVVSAEETFAAVDRNLVLTQVEDMVILKLEEE